MKKKLIIVSFFSLFCHTQVFDSNNYIPAVDDAFMITAEIEKQNILVNLSASDYIEMYGYINVGNTNGITNISFQGFKVSS